MVTFSFYRLSQLSLTKVKQTVPSKQIWECFNCSASLRSLSKTCRRFCYVTANNIWLVSSTQSALGFFLELISYARKTGVGCIKLLCILSLNKIPRTCELKHAPFEKFLRLEDIAAVVVNFTVPGECAKLFLADARTFSGNTLSDIAMVPTTANPFWKPHAGKKHRKLEAQLCYQHKFTFRSEDTVIEFRDIPI